MEETSRHSTPMLLTGGGENKCAEANSPPSISETRYGNEHQKTTKVTGGHGRWYLVSFLLKHTWRHLVMSCIFSTIVETCCFAQPFLILVIIRRDPPASFCVRYACAAGLIVYNFLQSSLKNLTSHLIEKSVNKARTVLWNIMNKKMAFGWKWPNRDPDVAKVFLSLDIERFIQTLASIEVVLVGPMSLMAAFTILLWFAGMAALPALGFVGCTFLLKGILCLSAWHLRTRLLQWTTKRITVLKTFISKVEAIKILCLEDRYLAKMLKYLRQEFSLLWKSVYLQAYDHGLSEVAAQTAIYLTGIILVHYTQYATLQDVILFISYLRILNSNVFTKLPLSITWLLEAWQLLHRFQNFLDDRDHEEKAVFREGSLLEENESEVDLIYKSQYSPSRISPHKDIFDKGQLEPDTIDPLLKEEEVSYWGPYWTLLKSWPSQILIPLILFCAVITQISGILVEWWTIKSNMDIEGIIVLSNGSVQNDSTASVSSVVSSILLSITLNTFSKDFLIFTLYNFSSLYYSFKGTIQILTMILFASIMFPWLLVPALVYVIGVLLLTMYTHRQALCHRHQDRKSLKSEYLFYDTESDHSWKPFNTRSRRDHLLKVRLWHGLRVNLLTSLFCTCIILYINNSCQEDNIGASALVLIYLTIFVNCVQVSLAKYVNYGLSIERMQTYANFEPEVEELMGEWCDWPNSGHLLLRNLCLPNNDLKQTYNISIPPGQKVGVLYENVDASHTFLRSLLGLQSNSGSVFLDGVDVTTVSVHSLRFAITLIHQELLYSGVYLRDYLDPEQVCSDDSLWDVLDEMKLKEKVKRFTTNLRFDLQHIGDHLDNVDQQLIGVARAVLHNSQVVIVLVDDSSKDLSSDYRVQDALRFLLPQTTRIKITSSVRKIIGCDKILILLDDGNVSEYANTWKMLEQGEPHYEQLIREVGSEEAAHIQALARNVYCQRSRMESIPEEEEELDSG